MAVAATHLTSSGSTVAASSFTTASISPSANRLVLCFVSNQNNPVGTPTITGASMTWTSAVTFTDSNTGQRKITVFRALSASPGSGALTIDFGGASQSNCAWSISEFNGVDISGTNGANAIVQSATGEVNGTSTTLSITLSAFASAANATWGGFRKNGTNNMTAGSGFSVLGSYDVAGLHNTTEFRSTNDTSVDMTWGSESVNCIGIALELRAFNPVYITYRPPWRS